MGRGALMWKIITLNLLAKSAKHQQQVLSKQYGVWRATEMQFIHDSSSPSKVGEISLR